MTRATAHLLFTVREDLPERPQPSNGNLEDEARDGREQVIQSLYEPVEFHRDVCIIGVYAVMVMQMSVPE